jgi:hypothetical protein
MSIKKLVFIFLTVLNFNVLHAQSNNDTQLWLGISAKKKFNHGFLSKFQYRTRIIDDITRLRGSFLYFTLEKKLSKSFNVETNYRLALIENLVYHRYSLGFELEEKVGKSKLSLRPLVQYQRLANAIDIETSQQARSFFRPRLTWETDLTKKVEIYAYVEPFYKIDNNFNINWWQNSLGLKYEVYQKLKLNPFFIWQPGTIKKNSNNNYIIGVDFEFNF